MGLDVLVGACDHYVGEHGKADRALALHEGGLQGVAVEGGDEHVAFAEFVPHPLPTEGGGHEGGDDLLALFIRELSGLFESAD